MIFQPFLQETFNTHGYVILDLLRQQQVEALLKLYDDTVAGDVKTDLYESSRANSLEKNSYINGAIRDVFAPSVARYFVNYELFGGTFMVKVSEKAAMLPLHQDWSVVDEDQYDTVFIWCALVDVSPANGGLFVLPGSQRYFQAYRSGSMPSVRIPPRGVLQERVVDIRLRAGQAIVYSDRLFHGSHPNTTTAPRIIVTGRVNTQGAQLVYYHKVDAETVVMVKASPKMYLKDIDMLARGKLPMGSAILKTLSHTYQPVTEDALLAKVSAS